MAYMDPYKVLGVDPTATDDDVKKAYRNLARKYHPDKYKDTDLKDMAEEKMKEVNAAYEEIQKMRSGGSQYSGGGQNYYGGQSSQNNNSYGYNYANVRRNINNGNIAEAESELYSVNEGDRAAEWNYLMGCVAIKKGHYVDAQRFLEKACTIDPSNMEYRQTYQNLRYRGGSYGTGYNTDMNGTGCGCSICDVCTALMCMDLCCRCG